MHTYSVDLKIVGNISTEEEISKALGIKPTTFFKKGEPKSPSRNWNESSWTLSMRPSAGDDLEWDSLEDGLGALLDQISPLKPSIDKLKQEYRVLIYVGHFATGVGGGPMFSPSLLKRLATAELELVISTYWNEDQEHAVVISSGSSSAPDPK
jgi:Domain of unknown function (DUF4279)